jgi:pimeloyl-ACP methyl ester carboxylesterase
MTVPASIPLILFSGLAADERIFAPQTLALPNLIVPQWPVPQPNDTLESYSERLADELRPHGRAIIGGVSFGGIVAQHIAKYLDPRAILLIGSIHSPVELPPAVRLVRVLRPLVPLIPVRLLQLVCRPLTSTIARQAFPHLSGLIRHFCYAHPKVFQWSLARLLDWRLAPQVSCPVFHLHGDRDMVLPLRYTSADTIVVGGGHLISLTHPSEVNAFILAAIAQTRSEQSRPLQGL